MNRILFYYYNLEMDKRYCQSMLQTSVPVEVIQATLASKEKNLEELIEVIGEKDNDVIFVVIHKTDLEEGIKKLNPDTLYNLATNKYIQNI